jgi:hypothetical protein
MYGLSANIMWFYISSWALYILVCAEHTTTISSWILWDKCAVQMEVPVKTQSRNYELETLHLQRSWIMEGSGY